MNAHKLVQIIILIIVIGINFSSALIYLKNIQAPQKKDFPSISTTATTTNEETQSTNSKDLPRRQAGDQTNDETQNKEPETIQKIETKPAVKPEEITPPPIQIPATGIKSPLTANGIVEETNLQRQINGLPPLSINLKLSTSAENKVNDMFVRQYFEHQSPTGEGPSDLANAVGYDYLLVGENLALGNYESDKILVDAWMNSPGHRENILNPKYKEIGVAIKFGTYEGSQVWMAVQEFGRPASDCPIPNESLEININDKKNIANELKTQIAVLYEEINAMSPKSGEIYNEKVSVYNTLIIQYNALVEALKTMIINYNAQVEAYRNCI
ncbi:MAG: CAP domain-containing protein [Candidatus Pacebacteria bacterium]|nr:CAP domain-containing protein [Candidatus Paceibacterota bacterium]